MGGEDVPAPDMGGEDVPSPDMDAPAPDMGGDDLPDMGGEEGGAEEVSMKSIQKLTGKLGQKIRSYTSDEELTSDDAKYIINSILSAIDLSILDDEDKEDIMSKFEGEEDMDSEMGSDMDVESPEVPDMGDEEMPSPEDMGSEEAPEEMKEYSYIDDNEDDEDFDFNFDFDMEEPKSPHVKKIDGDHSDEHDKFMMDTFESIFNESKVDKIIKGYFSLNESEKKQKITF